MKILTLALMLAAATPLYAQKPVKIFVTGARSPEGFVESPRLEESAKDIREILADKNHRNRIQIADSAEGADLVLTVTFSGNVAAGTTSTIVRGIGGGAVALNNPAALPAINVTLKVKGSDYTKDFSEVHQSFWKDLARRIVGQVDAWIAANQQVLAH
jgi:hypothetical protein